MTHYPLLDSYETLKQKIKQYEVDYYNNFNNLLKAYILSKVLFFYFFFVIIISVLERR